MILLRLFLRGFWIVFLTATNVMQVSHSHYGGAFLVGLLISFTWWSNAYRASSSPVPVVIGGVCYGLGGAVGTITGMALTGWWYGVV